MPTKNWQTLCASLRQGVVEYGTDLHQGNSFPNVGTK